MLICGTLVFKVFSHLNAGLFGVAYILLRMPFRTKMPRCVGLSYQAIVPETALRLLKSDAYETQTLQASYNIL